MDNTHAPCRRKYLAPSTTVPSTCFFSSESGCLVTMTLSRYRLLTKFGSLILPFFKASYRQNAYMTFWRGRLFCRKATADLNIASKYLTCYAKCYVLPKTKSPTGQVRYPKSDDKCCRARAKLCGKGHAQTPCVFFAKIFIGSAWNGFRGFSPLCCHSVSTCHLRFNSWIEKTFVSSAVNFWPACQWSQRIF